MLDIDGATLRGTTTAKYVSSFASRYRGRLPAYHVVIGFRTGDGEQFEVNTSVTTPDTE